MEDKASLSNLGAVVSVRGSVVDIGFDEHLPPIYSLLRAGEEGRIAIEVSAQLDAHRVRGIALTPTQRPARSLGDYYRTVELGLVACVSQDRAAAFAERQGRAAGAIGAIVFCSDRGLLGQFNEVLTDFVVHTLGALPGEKEVWAVGET